MPDGNTLGPEPPANLLPTGIREENMLRHRSGLFLLFLSFLLLAACAGDQQRQQQALEQRLNRLASRQEELAREQQKLKADTNIRCDNLDRELGLLRQAVEDSLARPEELTPPGPTPTELQTALKRLEERVHRLETPAAAGTVPAKSTATPPRTSPQGIQAKAKSTPGAREKAAYDAAYATFKRGDFKTARQKLQKFLATYPKSSYKVNALFWIAECYYKSGDYAEAIIKYDKIVATYPKHPKAASALLKQGFAFIQLNDKTDGRLILEKVIRNYPDSNQARIARRKLKILK